MSSYDCALSWSFASDAALAPLGGPAAILARQRERLNALVEAAQAAPYLAGRLGKRPAGGWRLDRLPQSSKSALMAHFDHSVTDPELTFPGLTRFLSREADIGRPYLGRYGAWQSSGSSGQPGVFVCDERTLAIYDALETVRRPCLRPLARLADPWFAAERIAFVGALGGHFAGIVAFERVRRLNPWLRPRMRAFSLLQPVGDLAAGLDAFRPTVVFTYPSAAVILAEEFRRGRLRMRPQEMRTGGETLTPAMRKFIGDTFGCPIGNEYGMSEFLPLAMECTLGHLHVNSDWAILEVLDDRGQPQRAGEPGARCLLTNLANHVQPLIRYELDDRVAIAARPCACGSPHPVVQVAGRSDDILKLGSRGDAIALSPLALTTVLEDEAGLYDFQLVQRGPTRLDLCCRHDEAHDIQALARARESLSGFLAGQGLEGISVRARPGVPLRTGAGGKVKRVLALAASRLDAARAAATAPAHSHRARTRPGMQHGLRARSKAPGAGG